MIPIEHFLLAAIPICAYVYLRDRHISLRLLAIVFVGSQFPDLIDKPLAYMFHLIPTGRVFAHSLPIAIPIWIVVFAYGWWTDRIRLSAAFVVAYLSHLLGDNYQALLPSDLHIPSDLLWPFRPPIPRSEVPHWAGPESINIYLWTSFSIIVLSITAYYLLVDLRTQLSEP